MNPTFHEQKQSPMKIPGSQSVLVYLSAIISCVSSAAGQSVDQAWQAKGTKGSLICGCSQGADAGLQILTSGGNAVDAAVASMLTQSVVESELFCFGSEVPIIIYDAQRKSVEVIAGLGAAPQLATVEWFKANRNSKIQGRGDIANCVVPGFLDACLTALDRSGTLTFTQCAQPMLEVLRQRANTQPNQVQQLAGNRQRISDSPKWIEHHRNFLRLMERLIEAEQAGTVDRRTGLWQVSQYFYRGPIAREIDAWSRANGGLLRYHDFARHHTRIDRPLSAQFMGHTIYKCGVWTQGPYLLQTLKMLETFGLSEFKRESTDYIHLVIEAMKLCLADRDAFFADPEFVDVPIERLMSEEYLQLRRSLIQTQTASMEQTPGNPYALEAKLGIPPQDHSITSGRSSDTSSCLVADQWGNVVAATPSGWGGVRAGDTGVELGSRLIGLTCWSKHPSELEPNKRPRITLTPTLVLKDGKPVLAISVAGGDQQDQASLQVLLNRIVFQLPADEAVRSPRFGTDHHINWFGHTPFLPGSLTLSNSFGQPTIEALRERGHQVRVGRPAATAVLLVIDPETGAKHAAGEPGRHARGW
jgi:gamma-glutamyltranspeptidase/glutathione hydrolase